MDQPDLELRNATYRLLVDLGRVPLDVELAQRLGVPAEEVIAGWRRLHDAHALVLDLDSGIIRMANPFAGRPTDFIVEAGGRSWFANCAWDAFGIGAALGLDSVIETRCPDCSEEMRIGVTKGEPDDEQPIFHVLVPAAHWWEDIGYT